MVENLGLPPCLSPLMAHQLQWWKTALKDNPAAKFEAGDIADLDQSRSLAFQAIEIIDGKLRLMTSPCRRSQWMTARESFAIFLSVTAHPGIHKFLNRCSDMRSSVMEQARLPYRWEFLNQDIYTNQRRDKQLEILSRCRVAAEALKQAYLPWADVTTRLAEIQREFDTINRVPLPKMQRAGVKKVDRYAGLSPSVARDMRAMDELYGTAEPV